MLFIYIILQCCVHYYLVCAFLIASLKLKDQYVLHVVHKYWLGSTQSELTHNISSEYENTIYIALCN